MKSSTPENSAPGSQNKDTNGRKRALFSLIMILIPLLLLVLTEFVLRFAGYGLDLTLYKKSSLYPGYYEGNNKVGKRYFTKFDATDPANDIFLINKPDSCYRIFVMGCSTTRGFPYQTGTMFSRILNYRLQDVFKHKRIEVVNFSMSAINSYAMVDVIDEILNQKPDAVLIYTGHNEYYGSLGIGSVENGGNVRWLKLLHLKLIRLRIYQLLQNLIGRITTAFGSPTVEKGTLMERIVRDKYMEFGSKKYDAGIEQFRSNMSEVIEKVRNKGIPIILSELISNIRDQKPFKSIKTDKNPGADEFYNKAQILESQKKYDEAREYYYKAKDYDAIKFRAPEALNVVLHELGEKYKIPVVPMKSYFEKNSPNGLIGNNLVLEHLHPNLNGYFLMADAFFEMMRKEHLISENWDTTLIKPSGYYRNNWGFTLLDSLVGDLKIKMILDGWPFKPETYVSDLINTYVQATYEDSLAFNCVFYKTHIEDEHISLALHYANNGNYMGAFNEYFSLIKCYPYIVTLYLDAFDYLVKTNDYQKEIGLFLSMPDKDNYYPAMLQIGEAYLKLNNPQIAIPYLIRARQLFTPDYNLKNLLIQMYNAYKAIGDKAKEEQILAEIRARYPDFNKEIKTADNNESQNSEVKQELDQAIQLMKAGHLDKALLILQNSLKTKETVMAYKLIGSIFFFKQDMKALNYYEKAYSMNPLDPEVLNNLFLLYLMKKDYVMASKRLDEYKMVSPEPAKTQRLYKMLEREMNN